MIRFYLLGLICFFSMASWGEQKASQPEKGSSQNTLKVVGRLVEVPGTMPPNDLYNYVYILKYRVLKVVEGKYTAREILVGQYNPLIPRDKIKDKMDSLVEGDVSQFKPGDKHELVLAAPLEKYWPEAVEDEYFDETQVRYFALRTDKSR